MSTLPVATPEASAPLSPVSRIINTFIAPSTTFTDLKRNPSWWVAWLLISVVSLIFVFTVGQKVGFGQMWENQMKANPSSAAQYEKMTPDQRAFGEAITKYVSYATPVIVLIIAVLVAAVLMATFNFGMGTEVPFGLSLALVFYSMLPGILRSLLAVVSLLVGADPASFDINNPAATNLGFFLNGSVFSRVEHPGLYTLTSWVDVFGIWNVILLGIGFSCVSKVKRGTAISVVAGWYVLVGLIFTGLAALRG
jgi:Yip1 domain